MRMGSERSRTMSGRPGAARRATAHVTVRAAALALAALALAAFVAACARRPDVAAPGARGGVGGAPSAARPFGGPDLAPIYTRMGLVVARGDLPFAGGVARFAAATPDSTLVLLSLSLANRALTFEREGERHRAVYEVRVDVRRGDATVRRAAADEIVRVATFKETSRADESVLFYQYLTLPPGTYTLAVAVRDAGGGRSGSAEVPLVVPRLGDAGLSTPVAVYDARPRARLDTLPDVVARARASAAFGEDSVVALYLEAYRRDGAPSVPVRVAARGDRDAVVWSDTASLARRAGALYAGVVRVPVARLGIGLVSLDVVTADAARDSARAPLFVSLGEELPVASFDDVLSYLRHYASPERLRALRETPVEGRAAAWAAFLRDSDPSHATAEHEGLREYFARVRTANARFGEDGAPGWTTDRGRAYIVLGEPDQIADPTEQDPSAKGRRQVWEYRAERLQLSFADQTGYGRWRLTGPSNAALQAVLRRKLVP
jgi:GWxTD domain-containing protein